MPKRSGLNPHSLSSQMILSFVALVILTTAAVGLPAIQLMRQQLDRQAWAQVDQGSQAAGALYAALKNELTALATLTAERPTLRHLVAEADWTALSGYLGTLQSGAGLDVVLLCGSDGRPLALAGQSVDATLCQKEDLAGLFFFAQSEPPQVWGLAQHAIQDEGATIAGRAIVGVALDDEFANQMRDRTGLEHALLIGGVPAAASLPELDSSRPFPSGSEIRLTVGTRQYYARRLEFDTPGLAAAILLAVDTISAAQRQLGWTLAGGMGVIVVLASLLGVLLARRISRPLVRLAQAASALSQGDDTAPAGDATRISLAPINDLARALDSPLAIETKVREVALVAQALEGARSDLQKTLAELRQEKAWTDHLLEAIVEGIVALDQSGNITFFSHGAERITGWRREEVLSQSCDQVFRTAETEMPFSGLIPRPGQQAKIPILLADGRQAILAATGARLLPSSTSGARTALVFRDVSEEEAVHRLLAHFLANVAHEFRTPLSSLAASVELLLDQAPDLDQDELQELLTTLHLGVLGLQTLVDNLLESASIQVRHFRVSPHRSRLADMIADAVGMIQPLLDKHGQRLVVELPAAMPDVHADPRRIMQVLINLLSNASKFGPDDAEVAISARTEDGWVWVQVSDQGPGIPLAQRETLFRRFARSTADQAHVGVGLGLSVVKTIVEAHGGKVGVSDRAGGGSVFWFTLRAVADPGQPGHEGTSSR